MTRFKCYDCGVSFKVEIERGPTAIEVGCCIFCGKGHFHVTPLPDVSPWISVEDCCPSAEVPVLVLCATRHDEPVWTYEVCRRRLVSNSNNKGYEWFYGDIPLNRRVTYWMPIPESPKSRTVVELLLEAYEAAPNNLREAWKRDVERLIGYVRKETRGQ